MSGPAHLAPTLPVYGPMPDPEDGGRPPIRMGRMDINYPAEGETYTLQGQAYEHIHDDVNEKVKGWVERIHPYLQAAVGMEHQPLQDFSFKRVTLRQALRILDEPIQSPRARIVLSRYLYEAANRLEGGLPSTKSRTGNGRSYGNSLAIQPTCGQQYLRIS